MRKLGILIISCSLLSCSAQQHSVVTNSQQESDRQGNDKHQGVETQPLGWVDYADPIADANMAIDKGHFHLLAISSKGLSLPGINLSQYNLDDLKNRCQLKQLATGGDAVYSKSQLDKGKAIVAYARIYNKIALEACLKPVGN